MNSIGLVLYGAPATGKDTITAALNQRSERFRLFERLKVGGGRNVGYRMTDTAELDRLENTGQLIWVNERYGARYAIDRPGLAQILSDGYVPVVHAGQPGVIKALRASMPEVRWIVVQLVTDLKTATARIKARNTGDTAERLQAREATPRIEAHATLDTATLSPEEAAGRIEATVHLNLGADPS
ncbi:kinase [Nocardia thailandica]